MSSALFFISFACLSTQKPPKVTPQERMPEVITKAEPKMVSFEISQPNETEQVSHGFPPEMIVSIITEDIIRNEPIKLLYSANPPFDRPEILLKWMDINSELYLYLPDELRSREDFKEKAKQNGIEMGLEITERTTARIKPDINARFSLYASDTTNGYLAAPRERQQFEEGDMLKSLKSIKADDQQTWYLITAEQTSDRAQEKQDFEMLTNVGAVNFEDFSLGVDAGWLHWSATEPAIFADQYISGIYTFRFVEHGDLAIYLDFEEISFEGFDSGYAFIEAVEAGALKEGDKVRLIWKKPASSKETPEIVWMPDFAASE